MAVWTQLTNRIARGGDKALRRSGIALAAGLAWVMIAPHAQAQCSAPTNVRATDGTECAAVRVTWSPVQSAAGYEILRTLTQGSAPTVIGVVNSVSTTTYLDFDAAVGQTYFYAVRAFGTGCGNNPPSTADTGFRPLQPLGPPASVQTSEFGTCQGISVSWPAVSNATTYEIARSLTPDAPTSVFSSSGGSTFLPDTTAVPGVTYYYSVRAVTDNCGPTAWSTPVVGLLNPAPAPTAAPTVTTNCQSTTVSWVYPGLTPTTTFRVARSTSPTDTNPNVFFGAATGVLSVQDGPFVAGTTYFYYVQPYNSCGSANWSPASVAVQFPTAPALTRQVLPAVACPDTFVPFSVAAAGGGFVGDTPVAPLNYQWQVRDGTGNWTVVTSAVTNLPGGGTVTGLGIDTPNANIKVSSSARDFSVRCRISNTCASIFSNVVALTVRQPCNRADITGLGGPSASSCGDGQLTSDDVIAFLDAFFNRRPLGDIAGVGGTLGGDGQFTADDVIVFLSSFFSPCG